MRNKVVAHAKQRSRDRINMKKAENLAPILARLAVPCDRVLYIHSSMDWMSRAGISIEDAINSLLRWVEDAGGTLVFPSFPFRGSHEAYLRTNPVFDVRQSPARVGLLNETFRRMKGVNRSIDPDLSIVAYGPSADVVVGDRPTGVDPTGPDSPFERVLRIGGCLLGLGVSLNYMNVIHVLDSRYRNDYPFSIYSDRLYDARSIDYDGVQHKLKKYAMLNDLQVHIKPSRVIPELKPKRDVFRDIAVGDTSFFVWELLPWEAMCVRHIEERLSVGRPPCWLEEVSKRLPRRP